jgi:hypothetical protein
MNFTTPPVDYLYSHLFNSPIADRPADTMAQLMAAQTKCWTTMTAMARTHQAIAFEVYEARRFFAIMSEAM